MIKFGLEDYRKKFGDWAKHHKEIGIFVKREYYSYDGEGKEPVVTNNKQLLQLMEK